MVLVFWNLVLYTHGKRLANNVKFYILIVRKLIRASQKKIFCVVRKKKNLRSLKKIILFASLKKKSFALLEKKNCVVKNNYLRR